MIKLDSRPRLNQQTKGRRPDRAPPVLGQSPYEKRRTGTGLGCGTCNSISKRGVNLYLFSETCRSRASGNQVFFWKIFILHRKGRPGRDKLANVRAGGCPQRPNFRAAPISTLTRQRQGQIIPASSNTQFQRTKGATMYNVIGDDGKEYGPVSLEDLKTWVAQGRVNGQTRVRSEAGTDWLPASQIPEINALLLGPSAAAPAAPPLPSPAPPGRLRSGLAITSLVFGLILCLGPLTGLPAIICGHIAHARARRSPREFGGAGLAIAGFILGYINIFFVTIGILPALLLPALSQAKNRAQSINCVNNLKQIGLAFKIWELDHNDQFPFNVSTNAGGTMELVRLGAGGNDRNPALHFQVLSNELNTPLILVCAGDASKTAALDFRNLTAANVSYELHTGPSVNNTNPQQALLVCPIHHHVLLVDGSVQQGTRTRPNR